MSFTLPALPYAHDALAPYISKETLEYHHDKHHATYVTKLNGLVKDTEHATKTLEQLIKEKPSQGIYNNAAQAFNHEFYFNCLTPNKIQPSENLKAKINTAFGSFEEFKKKFVEKCLGHFGSGWCWLILNTTTNNLEIVDTHDVYNPLSDGNKPLMTCDLWEHAYYIDTRNNRGNYVENYWNIINWEFVEKNLN